MKKTNRKIASKRIKKSFIGDSDFIIIAGGGFLVILFVLSYIAR